MLCIFQTKQRSTYAAVVPPPIFVNRPASESAIRMRHRKLSHLLPDQFITLTYRFYITKRYEYLIRGLWLLVTLPAKRGIKRCL